MSLVTKDVLRGFTIPGAEYSKEFSLAKSRFPEEELTTIGMIVNLRKKR